MNRRVALLGAPNATIAQLLREGVQRQRVVQIGAYRRAWTAADVERVVNLITPPPPPDDVDEETRPTACGSHAGYVAHWRRGEQSCAACKTAEAAYKREWRMRLDPVVWLPRRPPGPARDVALTNTQLLTLAAICRGLSNQGIADELGVGVETAKSRVRVALQLVGATDRLQAAVLVWSGAVRIRSRRRAS